MARMHVVSQPPAGDVQTEASSSAESVLSTQLSARKSSGPCVCERFVDKAPAQVSATLLDEGMFLCSIRTMYRILEEHGEVRECRNQRRHPNYTKPLLLAEAPNQVWSSDFTKLHGPVKWTYY